MALAGKRHIPAIGEIPVQQIKARTLVEALSQSKLVGLLKLYVD